MFLGAALQELKIMQKKLIRLQDLRHSTFNVLENKKIEVDFTSITQEINTIVEQIRILKYSIIKTNANTIIDLFGKKVALQELIIMIGDLNDEIQKLSILQPRGAVYLGGQAVEYVPQKRQDEMANIISEKEALKAELDKMLQAKNWSTELL